MKDKNIEIMTHVVAGYRNFDETEKIMMIMNDVGAKYIEVQIPFSDPIGDGPVITAANQYSIDKGVRVSETFDFVARVSKKIESKIIIMTYANIAYKMGFEAFFKRVKRAGAVAVILPDFAFDSRIDHASADAFACARKEGVSIIPVISPNTSPQRMEFLAVKSNEVHNNCMVYCTQRTGVTGVHGNDAQEDNKRYLQNAREIFGLPTAAGFGIKSVNQIKKLVGIVDIAVIGSHIINLYKDSEIGSDAGIERVKSFLKEIT